MMTKILDVAIKGDSEAVHIISSDQMVNYVNQLYEKHSGKKFETRIITRRLDLSGARKLFFANDYHVMRDIKYIVIGLATEGFKKLYQTYRSSLQSLITQNNRIYDKLFLYVADQDRGKLAQRNDAVLDEVAKRKILVKHQNSDFSKVELGLGVNLVLITSQDPAINLIYIGSASLTGATLSGEIKAVGVMFRNLAVKETQQLVSYADALHHSSFQVKQHHLIEEREPDPITYFTREYLLMFGMKPPNLELEEDDTLFVRFAPDLALYVTNYIERQAYEKPSLLLVLFDNFTDLLQLKLDAADSYVLNHNPMSFSTERKAELVEYEFNLSHDFPSILVHKKKKIHVQKNHRTRFGVIQHIGDYTTSDQLINLIKTAQDGQDLNRLAIRLEKFDFSLITSILHDIYHQIKQKKPPKDQKQISKGVLSQFADMSILEAIESRLLSILEAGSEVNLFKKSPKVQEFQEIIHQEKHAGFSQVEQNIKEHFVNYGLFTHLIVGKKQLKRKK